MSFTSKIGASVSDEFVKLPNRFIKGGFMPMEAVKREPRTNTTEELLNSIRAYAKDNPEIAEFAKSIKDIDPKHLGLAQDIIDLSHTHEMLNTNIDMRKAGKNGKSIMEHIFSMFPETSKNNPGALELCESVINNSDATNSKYFLARMFGFNLPKMGELSENMKAVKEVVPVIAKDTLSGGYTMDYSKNEEFFKFIQSLCSKETKPENIKFLNKIIDTIEKTCKKTTPTCNLDEIKIGDTKVIKENMEVLPYLLENAEAAGKSVNISSFLTKNVNLD